VYTFVHYDGLSIAQPNRKCKRKSRKSRGFSMKYMEKVGKNKKIWFFQNSP
jgi:hypothetical protein